MSKRVEELTTDVDRRAGERRFLLTDPFHLSRAQITIAWSTETGLADELPHYERLEHPPLNHEASLTLLDLVCALHAHSYMATLPASNTAAIPPPIAP